VHNKLIVGSAGDAVTGPYIDIQSRSSSDVARLHVEDPDNGASSSMKSKANPFWDSRARLTQPEDVDTTQAPRENAEGIKCIRVGQYFMVV
jgi:hypothetical protein